jgi:hypothetical protein
MQPIIKGGKKKKTKLLKLQGNEKNVDNGWKGIQRLTHKKQIKKIKGKKKCSPLGPYMFFCAQHLGTTFVPRHFKAWKGLEGYLSFVHDI